MTTHKTLEEARIAAKATTDVVLVCIIEIEHSTEGRCYIKCKAPMASLALALREKPMAEIRKLIAEHSLRTEAEIAADREQYLRERIKCDRCGKKIDGNTAYSQQESYMRTRVTAFYCEPCRALLAGIGEGEYTALQERAFARPSYEPHTKED
jgi:hypothetical protein